MTATAQVGVRILGELVQIIMADGPPYTFRPGVQVVETDTGKLAFAGGEQTLHSESFWPSLRRLVTVGAVRSISYRTADDRFGEGTRGLIAGHAFAGTRPTLMYDRRAKRISLWGGSYQVGPVGIAG